MLSVGSKAKCQENPSEWAVASKVQHDDKYLYTHVDSCVVDIQIIQKSQYGHLLEEKKPETLQL